MLSRILECSISLAGIAGLVSFLLLAASPVASRAPWPQSSAASLHLSAEPERTGEMHAIEHGTPDGILSVDFMNMILPENVCMQCPTCSSRSIQLDDGVGELLVDGDWDTRYYQRTTIIDHVTMDIDGDGELELVVAVFCNFGGTGYTTNIAALALGPDGQLILDAPALYCYYRYTRVVERLSEAEPGVLRVDGQEYVRVGDRIIEHIEFTAHWRLRNGQWEELEP